jgi:hypothetical protein
MSKQRFQAFISVLHAVQNLALLYAVILGILWYVKGRIWFNHAILPVHERIFYGLLILTVLVLVPLLALKASRPYSRYLLYQLPYFFGGIAWFFTANYCLNSLGKFWFIFGSCIVGFGVVPIALVGTIIKGHWTILGFICLQLFVTFGCRYLAMASVSSSGEENRS